MSAPEAHHQKSITSDNESDRARGSYARCATASIWSTTAIYTLLQLIFSSSTSNFSVEFGGIVGGKPRAPYAWVSKERYEQTGKGRWGDNDVGDRGQIDESEVKKISSEKQTEQREGFTNIVCRCSEDGLLTQRQLGYA
jgi:hypothetical protein